MINGFLAHRKRIFCPHINIIISRLPRENAVFDDYKKRLNNNIQACEKGDADLWHDSWAVHAQTSGLPKEVGNRKVVQISVTDVHLQLT